MKIEGSGANQVRQADQAQQAERAADARETTRAAAPGQADRVDVSADARLVADAVRAASDAPEIRRDVVERAKARLEAGEIGRDPEALADKIIDDLLQS
jgi:flagellar biosynthesis anti-sigma factor FlgM